jgi:hypothetical protein
MLFQFSNYNPIYSYLHFTFKSLLILIKEKFSSFIMFLKLLYSSSTIFTCYRSSRFIFSNTSCVIFFTIRFFCSVRNPNMTSRVWILWIMFRIRFICSRTSSFKFVISFFTINSYGIF